MKLINQSCIVTGASSGIGKEVALEMGRQGANVLVNYYSHDDVAAEVVEQIKGFNNEAIAIAVKADVSSESAVEDMFQRAKDEFGTVDILVANAGIQMDDTFHEMELNKWQRVIDVNLTGQFLCARAAVREFLRRGMRNDVSCALGKIIHMSSVHEVIPWAGHANYAASKGAIVMLMQSIAQEYGHKKIRVNSIAPGAIKTPINTGAWSTREALDRLLTLIPYERIGLPGDIAKAAVWLASDESDYVTGTTLFVDGGMTCYPGFTENG